MLDFDDLWFNHAVLMAKKSKDPRTQVGAVIVDPETKQLVSSGYNGPPRGWDDAYFTFNQAPDKAHKALICEHAERNAIYNAAKLGAKTNNCHIYVTMQPCNDCARAIHQSGIKRIWVPKQFSSENQSEMLWYLFTLKSEYFEIKNINWQFQTILIDGEEVNLDWVA